MTTITQIQYDLLSTEIYDLLMGDPERGLGDMGDCREAAKITIDEWMGKADIVVKLDTKIERLYCVYPDYQLEKPLSKSEIIESQKEFEDFDKLDFNILDNLSISESVKIGLLIIMRID